jgi:hypothetical protein
MVYFLMASLFESISHPFSIMLSLPFALVGVVWTLILTNTPNNLMAKIGLMVLVGVVVNNGIVLIDHINNLRRRGLSRSDAVLPADPDDRLHNGVRSDPASRRHKRRLRIALLPARPHRDGRPDLTYYELFDDLAIWVKRMWFVSSPAPSEPEPSSAAGD